MNQNYNENRRSFLKRSGLLGLGLASTAVLPVTSAEAFFFNKKEYKVSQTKLTMGTFVSMTAIHNSKDEAQKAIELAFAEIDRLSAMLTRFDANSPVAKLNSTGSLKDAPQEMLELVGRSIYYHKQTNGAFDITVKPLVDLYKDSFSAGNKPASQDVAKVLSIIGTEQIDFSNGNISFKKPGMGITLDGIAKGYIVDRASEVLSSNGLHNHLINAGGDIRTSGNAVKGKSWTVAVQDPNKNKQYPDLIKMNNGAVATSGNYEVFYDKEKLFHHIIDSKTGLSPQKASVTVMAPTVMDADALSTTVFVMESGLGIDFINKTAGNACYIIGANGKTAHSQAWPIG